MERGGQTGECERQQRGWRLPGTSRGLGVQPGATRAAVVEAEEVAGGGLPWRRASEA